MQHFETQSSGDYLKLIAASVCVLIIFIASPHGRANPVAVKSAAAEARVVVHARIELRQEGRITFPGPDIAGLPQVNVQECDPEIRKIRVGCVLLVYEIQ